jgi:ABC-type dipeptide/oligopeptide/nickel transport system permease subunit
LRKAETMFDDLSMLWHHGSFSLYFVVCATAFGFLIGYLIGAIG